MLKKYFILSLFALNLLFAPAVFAVTDAQTDPLQDIAHQSGYAPATANSLSETAGKIIKIVLGLLGTVFLALTVYAGVLWMTAAGEEAKVTKAVDILKASVIGLVIILAAYSITYFVVNNTFSLTA
jgi:hypothetical protein